MPATKIYRPAKYWDEPWNFVYGCTPAGAGCKNCWARALHEQRRTGKYAKGVRPGVYGAPFDDVCVLPSRLDMPLHWKKPRVVAVNVSGDSFHPKVPARVLGRAWRVMEDCPQHTFIVLTKRWRRMSSILKYIEPLPNVQLGVSVSTQAELDAAMPHLLATPAAVRLLSLEPLLEKMNLQRICRKHCPQCKGAGEIRNSEDGGYFVGCPCERLCGLGGIIVGCESGPKRRLCKMDDIVSVVEQAKAAGLPVFVKAAPVKGRASTDPNKWPESIRVRELPSRVA